MHRENQFWRLPLPFTLLYIQFTPCWDYSSTVISVLIVLSNCTVLVTMIGTTLWLMEARLRFCRLIFTVSPLYLPYSRSSLTSAKKITENCWSYKCSQDMLRELLYHSAKFWSHTVNATGVTVIENTRRQEVNVTMIVIATKASSTDDFGLCEG